MRVPILLARRQPLYSEKAQGEERRWNRNIAEEVDTVQKVYFGLPDPTAGEMWFPGAEPGSELGWGGHLSNPFSMAQGYFRWILFDDPEWDPASFDFDEAENFVCANPE